MLIEIQQENRNYWMLAKFLGTCIFLTALTAFAESRSTFVASQLRDPMEIAVAPDGDVFIVEREGRILRLHPNTGALFHIGSLDVTALRTENKYSDWAREDGILGIALDPDFAKNQYLYIYYSLPEAAGKMANRLSRFTLNADGMIDKASEKILLDVMGDREKRVCHNGGSLAFDSKGLLYISTGDNTNPFHSNGSAPIDDREGREFANAMRSAGNTNDLRGKILRIKPTENGYDIPAGNLFKPGTEKTRPEIYVMGLRNPFRISLDQKNDMLYWGEVGPDARETNEQGSIGYDEVNQTKVAMNGGWPFVIADLQPYAIWDFEKKKAITVTDPHAPKNPSRINTGLTELPTATPAFLYYPYIISDKFPELGEGGRNAMAGPIYYYDPSKTNDPFGKENDHSLMIYDWARGKAWLVKLNDKEEREKITPFMEKLMHPMDTACANDGSLYLLEYGRDWYFNTNGRLRQITPDTGNKAPTFSIKKSDATTYGISNLHDAENDPVTIEWRLTDGMKDIVVGNGMQFKLPAPKGSELRAIAQDAKGNRTIERIDFTLPDKPMLVLELTDENKTLSFGKNVKFEVGNAIIEKDIIVRARYIPPSGHDSGEIILPEAEMKMISDKGCIACHQPNSTTVGPRYTDVAIRYRGDASAPSKLLEKLKLGGSGVWGEIPMPPQAALNDDEAKQIVASILSLADGLSEVKGQAKGQITLSPAPANVQKGGAWEITAEAANHVTAIMRIPAE